MPDNDVNINNESAFSDIGYLRIESSNINSDYARNFRAEVRDGLWMLCRQWQLGEFIGEDAGTPFKVIVEAARASALPGDKFQSQPLEPFVEAEGFQDNLYTRIHTGQYLQTLLKEKNIITEFQKEFGIQKIDPDTLKSQPEAYQLYLAIKDTQIDGLAVWKAMGNNFDASGLKNWIAIKFTTPSKRDEIANKIRNYQIWFANRYPELAYWKTRSLDYHFKLTTDSVNDPELYADAYPGGKLDWDDITIENPNSLSNVTHSNEFIPTPCTYKGMPAVRWWEMEDGAVNLRKVDVAKTGILDTLFLEFGLLYGNDWLLIPYRMPAGEVCRIHKIRIQDVFGEFIEVNDASGQATNGNFALFKQSKNRDLFYLFPAISNLLESKPIEQVHFMRDEMANMVWAVESILPDQLGAGIPGGKLSRTLDDQISSGDGLLQYQLASPVPDHWTPFISVPLPGKKDATIFQRAKMPYGSTYKGMILSKNTTPLTDQNNTLPGYYINEEEISRLGSVVTRSYQRTRGPMGEIYVWIGRKNGVGRGEGSSGLVFDSLKYKNDDRADRKYILMPGKSISAGDSASLRMSANYIYQLYVENNTIIYEKLDKNKPPTVFSNAPWASAVKNKRIAMLLMMETGNLEVLDEGGNELWSSETEGNPGSMLYVHNDGTLVIYNAAFHPIWWWSPFTSNKFDSAAFDWTGVFG